MSKKTSVSLGSALDISHVEELKVRLEAALTKEPQVSIQAGKVERVDSAGLQLIYAFLQKAEVQGIQVSWSKPTDILLKVCRRLGMLEPLKLA